MLLFEVTEYFQRAASLPDSLYRHVWERRRKDNFILPLCISETLFSADILLTS
jgi:hypothetical protein